MVTTVSTNITILQDDAAEGARVHLRVARFIQAVFSLGEKKIFF